MTTSNAGKDMNEMGHSHTAGENVKWYCQSGKQAVSLKTKHATTYNLSVTLLGLYPSEMKTYFHIKICTQMLTAVLFIIAKPPRNNPDGLQPVRG